MFLTQYQHPNQHGFALKIIYIKNC